MQETLCWRRGATRSWEGIMELDRHRSADGLSQRVRSMVSVMLASLLMISTGQLRADPGYKVGGGKISFSVGSNVPFVKVSGSSSAVSGNGEGTIAGNIAQVRSAHVELDPKTLKTGISMRDQHMYEQVFTAANGSITPVVLSDRRLPSKTQSREREMGSQFPSTTDFARSDETGTLSRLGGAKRFRGNHQRRGRRKNVGVRGKTDHLLRRKGKRRSERYGARSARRTITGK